MLSLLRAHSVYEMIFVPNFTESTCRSWLVDYAKDFSYIDCPAPSGWGSPFPS